MLHQDKYFDKFRDAYQQLAKSANRRRDALKDEYKKNCNNNKCAGPALAALSTQLLKTKSLANNCPSFAAHGFVNGAFGTGTHCTMPLSSCSVPTPNDPDDDDDGDDDATPPPPAEPSPQEPKKGG